MERREFLSVAGMVLVSGRTVGRSDGLTVNDSPTVTRSDSQTPTLGPATFAQRIEKLQAELKTRKFDLYVAEPSTNFQYLTGYNPGRSERLILLMIPPSGKPAIVCPSFEVERLKRNSAIED